MADQSDWKSEAFRRKVISQIEDQLRNSNTQMAKSSVEMENHVFNKAKTRDEYLALVARLILHVKDYNNQKKQPGQGGMGVQGMPGPPVMGMQGMVPGANNMPPGQMPGGAGGMPDPLSSLHNMTFTPGIQQPIGMPGPTPQQQQQQQLQQQQQRQALLTQQRMIQQQQQHVRSQLQRQDAFMVTSSQPVPQMSPALQAQTHPNSPQLGSHVPSPVQPGSQQGVGSPMPMMTSPSGGIIPSPGPRSAMSAPSPSTNLNTPGGMGNPNSVGPSASPGTMSDDPYLEKLKSLCKFVDPLRRMIKKTEEGKGESSDQLIKLKNLHEILTNPNKRMPLPALQKCEQVLEKMLLPKMAQTSTPGTAPISGTPQVHMCQPLIDSVAANMKSAVFNHTLQKTFGPAMASIFGSPIRAPSPPPKRPRMEESSSKIPDILQGELARLDRRFKVKLDPLQHEDSTNVHLLCRLDDIHLPSVPPLLVTVPSDYPDNSPQCTTHRKDYEASTFLQTIQQSLVSHLVDLPSRFTFTSLLHMWEMSVRKACAPS